MVVLKRIHIKISGRFQMQQLIWMISTFLWERMTLENQMC